MDIRKENAGDRQAIHTVVAHAFGRVDEAELVDDLRNDGDLVVSLVAQDGGQICGHVALSRLKSPEQALALAPVSVSVEKQRRGIGAALIRAALEQARELGGDVVFVVGEPGYYARFGFAADTAAKFPCRFAGPHFMALCLTQIEPAPAAVVYPGAFDKLE